MSDDIEQQARQEGWVPADEWKGDPDQWRDAETFVQRGREAAPILASKNRKLVDEVDSLKSEVAKLRSASDEFRKVANESIERSRQERDQAINQLEQQRAKAITEGDGNKVLATERQIAQLRSEQPQPASQDQWNTQAVNWAQANQWYVRSSKDYDEDRKIYADGLSDIIMAELPHLRDNPVAYFTELSRRVEKRFEQRNDNRNRAAVENSPGTPASPAKAKSFAKLPQEARDGFEQMKFLMPSLTEEEYLKNYTE